MDSNLPLSGKVRLARCSLSRGQERLAACNQCKTLVLTLSIKSRTWRCRHEAPAGIRALGREDSDAGS